MKDNGDINSKISSSEYLEKELLIQYQIDDLLNNSELDEKSMLEQIVERIPSVFRYPDICRAEIQTPENYVFAPDLIKTYVKLSSDIKVNDKKFGFINVYYIKSVHHEKGIFIDSEKRFIKSVAEKIGKYLLLQKLIKNIDLQKNTDKPAISTDQTETNTRNWLKKYDLSEEEINKMLKVRIEFRKGEIVNKEHALISYIMLLANGYSKNYLEGSFERGFNFKILKAFEFIGLSGIYGNNIYHFSGSAITPCTMYLIDVSLFKEIVRSNEKFREHVLEWYCKITEGHLQRLSCIANKQSLGKVCEILLYLYEDVFDKGIIPSFITRKHIAELAAMSTESAVRILSELRKDKLLQLTSRGIEILNANKIKTLSMAG